MPDIFCTSNGHTSVLLDGWQDHTLRNRLRGLDCNNMRSPITPYSPALKDTQLNEFKHHGPIKNYKYIQSWSYLFASQPRLWSAINQSHSWWKLWCSLFLNTSHWKVNHDFHKWAGPIGLEATKSTKCGSYQRIAQFNLITFRACSLRVCPNCPQVRLMHISWHSTQYGCRLLFQSNTRLRESQDIIFWLGHWTTCSRRKLVWNLSWDWISLTKAMGAVMYIFRFWEDVREHFDILFAEASTLSGA